MYTNKWLNYTEDRKSNLEWRLVVRVELQKSYNNLYGNFGLLQFPPFRFGGVTDWYQIIVYSEYSISTQKRYTNYKYIGIKTLCLRVYTSKIRDEQKPNRKTEKPKKTDITETKIITDGLGLNFTKTEK